MPGVSSLGAGMLGKVSLGTVLYQSLIQTLHLGDNHSQVAKEAISAFFSRRQSSQMKLPRQFR